MLLSLNVRPVIDGRIHNNPIKNNTVSVGATVKEQSPNQTQHLHK